VQCPNVPDKAEWKLQGQVLTFTLPLTDEVRAVTSPTVLFFRCRNVLNIFADFVHDEFIFLKVSVIKAKVHEATGMPAGKQKLQLDVSAVVLFRCGCSNFRHPEWREGVFTTRYR